MKQGCEPAGQIRIGTGQGRRVLIATVLGSGISFLDGLVVNVALPRMDRDLHLGVAGLQWTVSGYLLTLSALLLLGGSLGDIYGRRRIYVIGIIAFAVSSITCGIAPNTAVLVLARLVQGIGGALMVPASLAIIQAVFAPEDRGAAIGAWTGMSAFFTGLGPFVGGVFVTYISWRWAFFINAPLGVLSVWITLRYVPESRTDDESSTRPDFTGAALAAIGLGGLTYWAIEGPGHSSALPPVLGVGGLVLLVAFVLWERRAPRPMMPLSIFSSAQFNWVNICTIIFYGAFVGGITFLGVRLQTGLGYSPLLAGVASLPVNFMLLTLSKRFGALSQRIGPKIPMTVGPALVTVALLLMANIGPGKHYWTFVLPAIAIWGFGLSMVVAPLTAAALGAADQRHVGVASALNNAASRVGQSFAIALLPALAGMGGGDSLGGEAFKEGYPSAMRIAAAMCALSALVALIFVEGRSGPQVADVSPAG